MPQHRAADAPWAGFIWALATEGDAAAHRPAWWSRSRRRSRHRRTQRAPAWQRRRRGTPAQQSVGIRPPSGAQFSMAGCPPGAPKALRPRPLSVRNRNSHSPTPAPIGRSARSGRRPEPPAAHREGAHGSAAGDDLLRLSGGNDGLAGRHRGAGAGALELGHRGNGDLRGESRHGRHFWVRRESAECAFRERPARIERASPCPGTGGP